MNVVATMWSMALIAVVFVKGSAGEVVVRMASGEQLEPGPQLG